MAAAVDGTAASVAFSDELTSAGARDIASWVLCAIFLKVAEESANTRAIEALIREETRQHDMAVAAESKKRKATSVCASIVHGLVSTVVEDLERFRLPPWSDGSVADGFGGSPFQLQDLVESKMIVNEIGLPSTNQQQQHRVLQLRVHAQHKEDSGGGSNSQSTNACGYHALHNAVVVRAASLVLDGHDHTSSSSSSSSSSASPPFERARALLESLSSPVAYARTFTRAQRLLREESQRRRLLAASAAAAFEAVEDGDVVVDAVGMDMELTVWDERHIASGLMERAHLTHCLRNLHCFYGARATAATAAVAATAAAAAAAAADSTTPVRLPLLPPPRDDAASASCFGTTSTSCLTRGALASGEVELSEVATVQRAWDDFGATAAAAVQVTAGGRGSPTPCHAFILGATSHWVTVVVRQAPSSSVGWEAEGAGAVSEMIVLDSRNDAGVLESNEAQLELKARAEAEKHRGDLGRRLWYGEGGHRRAVHARFNAAHRSAREAAAAAARGATSSEFGGRSPYASSFNSSSSFSAVPTEVTDAPLSSEALQELLEFDVEALTRETLQPWLDLRFAVDAIHRGCLLPPASASAPEEAGTAGSTTRTTTTRCSLMGMYLRESFDHLRSTFAAAATLDGAAYSWLKPEPQRKLLVPKMLVPRASSLSSFSSSTSSSPLNSTPPAWSFVGLEHWLEDSYHPAVFENGFLRRARTIWRGPSAGSGSTEEKGVPVVPALLGGCASESEQRLAADVAGWAEQVHLALLALPDDLPPLVRRFRDAVGELCRVVGAPSAPPAVVVTAAASISPAPAPAT
jgi:hypothetical protein